MTPLGGYGLTEYLTCPSLGDFKFLTDILHYHASLRRAYKFPREASLRIALSSERSATGRFKREFSCSSSLSGSRPLRHQKNLVEDRSSQFHTT